MYRHSSGPSPAGAFLIGFLAGGAAAVLFAPWRGRDLRRKISAEAMNGCDAVKRNLSDAVDSGTELLEKGKERILAEQTRITTAVDAARKAYANSAS
jgi:gas vesicle protein